MVKRLEFDQLLLDTVDTPNVYFQPPEGFRMDYPCVVYKRTAHDIKYANNLIYLNKRAYMVSVIDRDPDSVLPSQLFSLKFCDFNSSYVVENLYHYVFTIYY